MSKPLVDLIAERHYARTGSPHTDHFKYWDFARDIIAFTFDMIKEDSNVTLLDIVKEVGLPDNEAHLKKEVLKLWEKIDDRQEQRQTREVIVTVMEPVIKALLLQCIDKLDQMVQERAPASTYCNALKQTYGLK